MRNLRISLCIAGLAVAVAGCSVFAPKMTKDELLANIKQQVDPNSKLKAAKTKVIIGKVNRGSKLEPGRIIIKVKHPDKWRMLAIVPKVGIFIRAYDGKVGWEFSTKTGYQELKGKHLDELRLQTALAVHRGNYKEVFQSVKFDGEEKVVGELCYKIIAQPKATYNSQPVIFYINKATFLPFMTKETYDGSKGTFPLITIFSDYKKHDGVMIPMTRIFDINNKLIDVTVQSVEWNEYIDDADFSPPEQF